MGTFTSGSIQVYLANEKDAKAVKEMFENIEERLKNRLGREVSTSVYEIEIDEDSIECKVSSDRTQNGEFQVEQIVEELKLMVKNKEISEVVEFTADLMIEHCSWQYDSDDFEESE